MTLYMAVENDKYELPVAIAEKQIDLAKMLGISCAHLNRMINGKRSNGNNSKYKIYKIEIEEM